jgi:hypothetical protein
VVRSAVASLLLLLPARTARQVPTALTELSAKTARSVLMERRAILDRMERLVLQVVTVQTVESALLGQPGKMA